MTDKPRLIERAFPLKQTSLDSVHEKNVRHGHISTLHIWPARRPLAACRAALIATLLPDPGTPEARKKLCEKFAGKVVEKSKKEGGETRIVEETEGGILHWKRETENAETLAWIRKEIRKAYGGRAPKVLDPFAGGGAIPLEAMRLGCEVTASDLNPVAWFILKCTLEYPQRLAGQTRPLPEFILSNQEFMTAFLKSKGLPKKAIATELEKLGHEKVDDPHLPGMERSAVSLEADLAWHVRAWGKWVIDQASHELAPYYPTYADFEPIQEGLRSFEKRPMQLVPLREDARLDMVALNGEFSEKHLRDTSNPRWVAKPTVAYLWARTVKCKNCRAVVPLLKTLWLCNTARKRTLLTIKPEDDRSGVAYGVEQAPKVKGAKLGEGTMSRAGVQCPCCQTIMSMTDIKLEACAGRMLADVTAVVVDTPSGKDYRAPTEHELRQAKVDESTLRRIFASIPNGQPTEPTPAGGGSGAGRAFSVHAYGMTQWIHLFMPRQLAALGSLTAATRAVGNACDFTYTLDWREAILCGLAIGIDRIADRQSTVCRWDNKRTNLQGTFTRFALPITWDFCEGNPLSDTTGNYLANLEWLAECWEHVMRAAKGMPKPTVRRASATDVLSEKYDAIITDPPYYDAIPYSDLMDFFHVWLRRSLTGLGKEFDTAFEDETGPKWNHDRGDGELIDDSSRHEGDANKSKQLYEDGMARVFSACCQALNPDGRFVVVFAHKHPDAWETLVGAIVRAGFVVDGSWPIQTEMGNRTRAMTSAALSSSIWLVCRKRLPCRPGWAKDVVKEMRSNIQQRLTDFWDAGIRGPDFVWAALGPALEAYSKHPVVKTDDPENPTMSVSEFLTHVRRIVIDFVVGRVLSGGEGSDIQMADRLDSVTAYYLLHRNDFGMNPAPAGACILYALSCGVSDHDLVQAWGLTASGKTKAAPEVDEEEAQGSGSEVRLLPWIHRKGKSLGIEAPGGREIPVIDRIHRLLHLWAAGDVQKVDTYLDDNALRRNELFRRVLQAIIELAEKGSDERALLESISNHVQGKGAVAEDKQTRMFLTTEEGEGKDAGTRGRGDTGMREGKDGGRGEMGMRGRGDTRS